MDLPQHYRKLYVSFIKLACMMSLFGLIAGILFQESTRKIPYAKLPPGLHWEAVYHLALLHGHIFLIGVLIPLSAVVMMHLCLKHLGGQPLPQAVVKWGGALYHAGAGMTVLLLLYKGYHFVLSVRGGNLDFASIDHQFFGGQEVLRQIVYGFSHTAMGVGLGLLVVGIWRALPKKNAPAA